MLKEHWYAGERTLKLPNGEKIRDQEKIDKFLRNWEERNTAEARSERARNFLKNFDLTPESLVEQERIIKEAEITYHAERDLEGNQRVRGIYRESDLCFWHGTQEDAENPGYKGLNRNYILKNDSGELLVSICAPGDSDPRQWTMEILTKFRDGTSINNTPFL